MRNPSLQVSVGSLVRPLTAEHLENSSSTNTVLFGSVTHQARNHHDQPTTRMTQSPARDSAILYHNAENTIFLIDTPHSIALAQESVWASSTSRQAQAPRSQDSSASLQGEICKKRRWLLSTPPLETPFPSTEPKSHAARAKVLERIPASEQRFHGEFIRPLVESALVVLRDEYQIRGGRWCLPRRVRDDDSQHQLNASTHPAGKQFNSARKRRNKDISETELAAQQPSDDGFSRAMPPVILSSTAINSFESMSDLQDSIVENVSSENVTLAIRSTTYHDGHMYDEYTIPPYANFILCTLPISQPECSYPSKISAIPNPIPAVPQDQKFNLLLFDPPWPNRSVRRSKHYQVNDYSEMEILTQRLRDILRTHAYHTGYSPIENFGIGPSQHDGDAQCRVSWAAIWITNAEKARRAAYDALTSAGFRIAEEWIWVKTTADGQPISVVDGLWRKPYEILVIGRADQNRDTMDLSFASTNEGNSLHGDDLLGIDPAGIKRRVIAAVPDLHSRKPNLKEVFERVFFMEGRRNGSSGSDGSDASVQSYSAMEVFARNLSAGWWACGNEVLKFNARECWVDE
ncbi:uncharacterized protein N7496_006147 [Penicillium cataractarum]|uniref:MT-A70-domain-containing protein n=1 Tax=Penicillium cataractarum TaxID=2100454 RepID=A0A9W9S186_9EURO|nr:uncharacterized protein N7496_006147 [Penicillium cataractarum]KAJ5370055.1 hypothetical protein N7496_006147 [Penicillium cataractarum]